MRFEEIPGFSKDDMLQGKICPISGLMEAGRGLGTCHRLRPGSSCHTSNTSLKKSGGPTVCSVSKTYAFCEDAVSKGSCVVKMSQGLSIGGMYRLEDRIRGGYCVRRAEH